MTMFSAHIAISPSPPLVLGTNPYIPVTRDAVARTNMSDVPAEDLNANANRAATHR
jgi:hypothetical protein